MIVGTVAAGGKDRRMVATGNRDGRLDVGNAPEPFDWYRLAAKRTGSSASVSPAHATLAEMAVGGCLGHPGAIPDCGYTGIQILRRRLPGSRPGLGIVACDSRLGAMTQPRTDRWSVRPSADVCRPMAASTRCWSAGVSVSTSRTGSRVDSK